MKKFFTMLKKILYAISVMTTAVFSPISVVVRNLISGQNVSLGQLGFAIWRVLVWCSFLMCMTGSIGIPPLVALLLLIDLFILGVQTVFVASPTERKS